MCFLLFKPRTSPSLEMAAGNSPTWDQGRLPILVTVGKKFPNPQPHQCRRGAFRSHPHPYQWTNQNSPTSAPMKLILNLWPHPLTNAAILLINATALLVGVSLSSTMANGWPIHRNLPPCRCGWLWLADGLLVGVEGLRGGRMLFCSMTRCIEGHDSLNDTRRWRLTRHMWLER